MNNKELAEHVLQMQLQKILELFNNKKRANIVNAIEKIIVICPTPRGESFSMYYCKDKWESLLPIEFVQYKGENKHHSYDQYLQGYLAHPTSDYYIVIEDDYFMDCTYNTVDTDLIKSYRAIFPDNIGYLATWAPVDPKYEQVQAHGPHAAISNGIISRDTFEKIPNLLSSFYSDTTSLPQVIFSRLFQRHGIPIRDFEGVYNMHFWDTVWEKTTNFSEEEMSKSVFLPVQIIPKPKHN
jgi:hypothetical protein